MPNDPAVAEVIDLVEYKREKQNKETIDKLIGELAKQFNDSAEVTDKFYHTILHDPKKALSEMQEYLDKSRGNHPDRAFAEAIAGGPCEYFTAPILRAVGTVYASLEKKTRKEGLTQCLNFLDGQNWDLAQRNVQYIHEPWLAGDIIVNRPIYNHGCDDYWPILEQKKTWREFAPEIEKAHSKFFIAWSISDPKRASLEIRTALMNEMPVLVDRTQDAIAGFMYRDSIIAERTNGTQIKDSVEELLKKYDPTWHEAIKEKIKEEKWILDMDRIDMHYPSREKLLEKARQKAAWNLRARSNRGK